MLKSGQLMQCRWPKFRFENFVTVINAQFKQERRKGLQKIVWLSGLHFSQETNKKSCRTYIHHVDSQNILSNHKKEFLWQSQFLVRWYLVANFYLQLWRKFWVLEGMHRAWKKVLSRWEEGATGHSCAMWKDMLFYLISCCVLNIFLLPF